MTGENWTQEETSSFFRKNAIKALRKIKEDRKGKKYKTEEIKHHTGVRTWIEKEIKE